MDPSAALNEILEMLSGEDPEQDRWEIYDRLQGLVDWIGMRGFLPKVHQHANRTYIVPRSQTDAQDTGN